MTVPPTDPAPTRTKRVWPRALGVALVFLIVLGGGLGSLAGKLTDQEKNTSASFLSKTAESTRALKASGAFVDENNVPTIVLYERASGITAADKARAVEDLTLVRNQGDWLTGSPAPPVVSDDGKALELFLPFAGKDQNAFSDNIKSLRTQLKRPGKPAGLSTYVTGVGGTQADLVEVFGSLNGTLLVATVAILVIILLAVYRSAVLWLLPLLGAVLAFSIASGILYLLAKSGVLVVNGQSAGILPVMTLGAATDYALLLTSRYREELHRHESTWEAMKVAWRGAAPAILASAATVILSLLCLLFSELEGNKGLGPVVAIGVACAALTMLVFLPAMLLMGRWLFWPRIPRVDGQDPVHEGLWKDLADKVSGNATAFMAGTLAVLVVLCIGVTGLKSGGIPQDKALTNNPESSVGQQHLAKHFAAGSGAPVDIVGPASQVDALVGAAKGTKGVTAALPYTGDNTGSNAPLVKDGKVLIEAILAVDSTGGQARDVVKALRSNLDTVSKDALVGGFTAIDSDIHDAAKRDNKVILPIVLLLITVVLAILLRALVAPLVLIATVVLSYGAALGAASLVFNNLFGFVGADASFPLFAFIFLVALGVDYNIFLMSRVREEAPRYGTREGMRRGLTVTGGVITSAGIVLAATFSVLATLPLVFLAEIGFVVAFGVVLDTFVVRSLLVPAIVEKLGDRIWWPARLGPDEVRAGER
ncbi:MAG: MmpL protein [Frankiales bacterium]|nr:MmpL protein [Frankiales bacterium]